MHIQNGGEAAVAIHLNHIRVHHSWSLWEKGGPCDSTNRAPSWGAIFGPTNQSDFIKHLFSNCLLLPNFSCFLVNEGNFKTCWDRRQSKNPLYNISRDCSIEYLSTVRFAVCNPNACKILTALGATERKWHENGETVKDYVCLLSKQSLPKNLPNASTDHVLPSAEKNQEKQFHVVRNLALILSSVKIKSCPISILLPCGKRSQYTIEGKKSLHPNYHHQISWGLRFYLPAKGETVSK